MIENAMGQRPEQATPISEAGEANEGLSLRIAHLNFLGRGLVRLAHDLKNHLATINESAGLMVDLLKHQHKQRSGWRDRSFKGRQTPSLDMASLLSVLERIEKEVVQGATLIQNLGRFGHRLEEPRSVFDGEEALEEIRDVLLEQVGEKGIHLEIRPSETKPMIETDLSGFQMAVVWNVEKVMAGLEQGHRIVLETAVRKGLFQVCLSSPCAGYPPRFVSEELCDEGFYGERVEELGGQMWDRSDHGKYTVTLAFPLAGGKT